MARDTRDTATRLRQARQDALREFLSRQKHEEQAVEAIKKMADAPDQFALTKWDKVFGAHMRILDKYLPAQKEVALDAVVDAVAEIRSVNVSGVAARSENA
jgi:hypothetical protein